MKHRFDFSVEKNLVLKQTRGLGFEEIIEAISRDGLIGNIKHLNRKRYPNQKIFIVKIKSYIYAVPYVFDRKRNLIFLKTIYPSRKLTKKYLKV